MLDFSLNRQYGKAIPMGSDQEGFTRLRHEFRTFLNHIMGYSEILIEDAREYEREDIIPELRKIHEEGEQVRDFIINYLDPDTFKISELPSDEIKKILYGKLYSIIGISQQLRKSFEEDETGYFILDLDKILIAANKMLDLIDTRIIDTILIAQAEAGGNHIPLDLNMESFNPGELLAEKELAEAGRILIVDDNEMNREMLSRHLERQGHTIIEAENGIDALSTLEQHAVDIIILDIMMPGMNGYQVLERIKSDQNLRFIPVIMISALDDMDSIIRCIEMGAEDYLPKSFDPVLLKARIEAGIEKETSQRSGTGLHQSDT